LLVRGDDEVVVVDNTSEGAVPRARGLRVVAATGERSSYHARNAGARVARGEWLLFMDADCVPEPTLLDAYFAEWIGERVGALAGEVIGDPTQDGFLPRYARDRNLLSQTRGLHDVEEGAAVTANLLVRKAAFAELGGFTEGIRSGGDFDFSRRLLSAGWTIGVRAEAIVHHRHRESLRDHLGATARYAAGARWLNERYPGSAPRWPLVHGLAGSARDVAVNLARRRFEEAAFRALDGVGLVAHNLGYRASNAARSS
jgi:GT2 family glycosyltransferase